jgi:DNA-binding CsgD family transcriptional regulator
VSPGDLAGQTAVLDRWFAAFNRHDVDALCEMADPAVEVIPIAGTETTPPGTTYHGREGLRALLRAGFDRYPHLRVDHSRPQPSGGAVTVDLQFRLDDGVTKPTLRSTACNYRIADGHIRRIRAFDRDRAHRAAQERGRASILSPREREVLSLLATGLTIPEIASELVLSPLTVRTHVRNAKDKLGARTTAHAVAIALDEKALDV